MSNLEWTLWILGENENSIKTLDSLHKSTFDAWTFDFQKSIEIIFRSDTWKQTQQKFMIIKCIYCFLSFRIWITPTCIIPLKQPCTSYWSVLFFGRNENNKKLEFCKYNIENRICAVHPHKISSSNKKIFIFLSSILFSLTILCDTLGLLDVNHKKVIFKHKKNRIKKRR